MITVTGATDLLQVGGGPTRGHAALQPGTRAHLVLSPAESGPLVHRCLFLELGPFPLRRCGEGEWPRGGQPRPGRLLSRAPACCPPTAGAGGLCPREGGTFRLSSQHILWPVPPILPPTAGAGPSALPGVLSSSPFPRGVGVWQSALWGLSLVPLRVCVTAPGRQRTPQAWGGAAVVSAPRGHPPAWRPHAATMLVLPKQHPSRREPGALSRWASQGAKAETLPLGSGLCKEGASSSRPGAASAGPAPPACSPGLDTGPQTLSGATSEPRPDLGWARRRL